MRLVNIAQPCAATRYLCSAEVHIIYLAEYNYWSYGPERYEEAPFIWTEGSVLKLYIMHHMDIRCH